MSSDAPAPPLCPDCRQPMKLVRTIPHVGGLPEIQVFYCSRCKQAETIGAPGGYSGGYCAPTSDRAPAAVPKRG